MRPSASTTEARREHGSHTLRVWRGTVVGCYGDDVFVELTPRMQGVISARHFDPPAREGEQYDFTLRGQEDGLWALARVEELPLVSWDRMEAGSILRARVIGLNHGGLELKIGQLHAFMPRSHCGLPRGADLRGLLGQELACQVTEVDRERQRVLVSRKLLLERERADERQRAVHGLRPGQVVRGRVTRLEPYGAFVAFGAGLEGLIHVSNLSHDPVAHPSELLRLGESVECRVLTIRREGKRIGLGLKQMQESPWKHFALHHGPGELIEGIVTRQADFGVFVAVERGIQGLLPNSESGLPPPTPARAALRPGQALAVRIVAIDAERERLTLSRLHPGGAQIRPEEAAGLRHLEETRAAPAWTGSTLAGALRAVHLEPRP
jgi:small subunit ribosomal protein S1